MKQTSLILKVAIPFAVLIIIIGMFIPSDKAPVKTSGALQSLDMWAMQRAYPGKTIPETGFYDAYVYSKANLVNETDNLSDSWESIGPKNMGGRTLALAFNPLNGNTLYAGSASGGLWRSYTAGVGAEAWNFVPTGFPVLSVSSVAISHTDTNVMYIGTGEVYGYQNANGGMIDRITRGSYGIGILKTTNNGMSWSKSLDWSYNQSRGVQVLKINPRNANIIWAGTTEGTFVSYDAGLNWRLINNTIMATDIAINPSDTGTVFIACGNLNSSGNGIYRTFNSGNSWEKLNTGLPGSYGGKTLLAMYQSSPNVLYASIGFGFQNNSPTQLCKTVDNGNTWTLASNLNYATYQGWYSHFVGVSPVDSSKVIVGGIDIYKSTDGGVSLEHKSFWNIGYFGRPPAGGPEGPPNFSHADHHAIVYSPGNPDMIYFANDGGVFRTTDGGETFEGCNGGYQSTQFYPGFSSAPTDSIFAIGGMQDNGSGIYDGQDSWIKIIGGDGCWTGINYRNKDSVYGSYQFLSMLASIDGGQNFYTMSPSGGYVTAFVAPFVLGNVNPQVIYAGRTVVFKTTSAGDSWDLTNNGTALNGNNPLFTLSISKTNDDVVYAATAPLSSRAKIFKTEDGGISWFDITGTIPDRFITDLAVDPLNDNIVYCTVSGFGTPHVFKSADGGFNWFDISSGLPDAPTSSVTVDPNYSNSIYIGNDLGVYVSTNAGGSWAEFQSGMPDASIVIDLSISKMNRKLRSVTHGKGIFERYLLDPSVGINETSTSAEDFQLYQNYPNPFNPKTIISYSIPRNIKGQIPDVKLIVFNSIGQEVSTLVNEKQNAGRYEVTFDGNSFSSGIYFYKLEARNGQAGDFSVVRKMLLVK